MGRKEESESKVRKALKGRNGEGAEGERARDNGPTSEVRGKREITERNGDCRGERARERQRQTESVHLDLCSGEANG